VGTEIVLVPKLPGNARKQLSISAGGFAMSKFVSTFLATTASLLAAACVVAAGAGSGAVASSNVAPATTTTTVNPDGNPWHG
jgi:hypothetical protein